MTLYYQIYLGLISVALIIAAYAVKNKHYPALFILVVLAATLIDEAYSTIAYSRHKDFSWIYHLFCPIEYTLLSLYYLKVCPQTTLRTVAKYSIPVFVTFSLCISYLLYRFTNMPAININVEGVLLFIWYVHLLFTIEVPMKHGIYQHPDFWMAIGMLVFYGGVFVFLGLYPYLFDLDFGGTMKLFDLITKPLNIVFYLCMITGLVCMTRSTR